MKPNNAESIKELNRKNILNIIRSTPVSRAMLSEKTGLTRAAITFIINDLTERGIVYDREIVKSSVGRYPSLLDINANYGCVAGVLLERDLCCVCIADYKCNIISETKIDISSCVSAVAAIDKIALAIDELLIKAQQPKEKLLSAGIICPGPVDYKSGVILNPPHFEMWHMAPAAQMLSGILGVPVYLENISVSLALAEYRYGGSASFKSSLFIETTTGIGSALIVDGKVFRGSAGFGAELGHICVDVNGEKCSCGNRGCLEMYASLKSLKKLFGDISWVNVIDGLTAGDKRCTMIFEHEVKYLSAALANAANCFDLDAVILPYNFAYRSDILISRLQQELSARSMISRIHPVQIKIAEFVGSPSPALRASAAIAIEHNI